MSNTPHATVERIAFEVGRLNVTYNLANDRIETRSLTSDEKAEASRIAGECADGMIAAAEFASYYKPVSIVGTLFQAMVAAGNVENLLSCVGDGPDRARAEKLATMVERQLRGAVDYLEARGGTPLTELGGRFFYNRDVGTDPFAHLGGASAAGPTPSAEGEGVVSTTPIATVANIGEPRPYQPAFASVERQLLALTERYVDLEEAYHQCSDIEYRPGVVHEEGVAKSSDHVLRMQREVREIINATRCTTLRELGLKARIVAFLNSEWWEDSVIFSADDLSARALVEDVMSLAGVTRIPGRDLSLTYLADRAARGCRRHDDDRAEVPVPEAASRHLVEAA